MLIDFPRKNGKMALLKTQGFIVIYQQVNFDEWFRY